MPATEGTSVAWHLITCEFPPQIGGVADFTHAVATGLAERFPVHVWTPTPATSNHARVIAHALDGGYRWRSISALDRALGRFPAPRRLFVQWVPHGYGYKSLNVPFCTWVRHRSRLGDEVDVMVHEPFLPFDARRVRQNVGALVHRGMLMTLLRAASRVWVATPSFVPIVERFGGRRRPCAWLPVPSPITRVHAPHEVAHERMRLGRDNCLVGYFGTCSVLTAPVLKGVISHLAARRPDARILLFGRDTDTFAEALLRDSPGLAQAVVGLGVQPADRLSVLIQCCDVLVQPYPDGVSARRTSLTALLQHGSAVVTNAGPRTEAFWSNDGPTVALVRPEGAKPLVEEAERLLASPADRQALGERARDLYEARFAVRHVIAALAAA